MAYSLFETAELGPLISKKQDRAFRHQRAPLRSQWTDHSRLGGLLEALAGWSGHHHHGPPVGGPGPAGR